MMTKPPEILEQLDKTSPFMEVLYRRRAVRSYKPDVIDGERLQRLLDAAVHAPTARHQEPWQFVVVQNRELLKRISDRAKELARANAAHHGNVLKPPGAPGDGVASQLADPDYNIFYDAGTLVIICARLTPEFFTPDSWPAHSFVVADCWLAAENLMLAACADGLGTCCIGFAVPALNDPVIKAELGIPSAVEAFAPIIVGVPAVVTPLVPRKPPVLLRWIR
jgi:nitroreductase